MHKGYTLVNLINFFSSTTNTTWNNNSVSAVSAAAGRYKALCSFVSDPAAIAAGRGVYASLGSTPRGRILRALRNRKRTGLVLG